MRNSLEILLAMEETFFSAQQPTFLDEEEMVVMEAASLTAFTPHMANYIARSHHHVSRYAQPATSRVEVARRARCSRELFRQRKEQHELLQLGRFLKCPDENEEHVLTACIFALHTLHQQYVRLRERYR